MYIGRFLVVGPDVAAYRVSSRSFPNRRIVDRNDVLTVAPTPEAPETENPYVSYNCLRFVGDGEFEANPSTATVAIVGNGSHVDPIAEKVALGYPPRDALAGSLLAMDYEKDDYDTPRIAGTVGEDAYVGIVRRDGLVIERVDEPTLIATYEHDSPTPYSYEATTAEEAAVEAYGAEFEHPVCAAGVVRSDDEFRTSIFNGE